MRTTITLDDQLEREIKMYAASTGQSFKSVINELLRLGLNTHRSGETAAEYVITPASLGQPQHDLDLIKALALSDALEDEARVARWRGRK